LSVGGEPFYLKFWVKLTLFEQNRRFSVNIRSQRSRALGSALRAFQWA